MGTEIRILRAKRSLWNETVWNLAGKSRFSCQLVLSSLDARFHKPHATPRGTSFHFYSPIDPTYAPVKSLFTDLRRWRYKKTKMYRRSRDICKFISSRMLGRGWRAPSGRLLTGARYITADTSPTPTRSLFDRSDNSRCPFWNSHRWHCRTIFSNCGSPAGDSPKQCSLNEDLSCRGASGEGIRNAVSCFSQQRLQCQCCDGFRITTKKWISILMP